MFKYFLTIMVALMVFVMAAPTQAETWAFGGIGMNAQMLRDVENTTFDLKTDAGFSGGLATTLSDKVILLTVYDYTVNEVEGGGVIFVNEVMSTAGYKFASTGNFNFWLLGGFEVTDGNIDDYGTFLSGVTGGLATYSFNETFSVFGGANVSISDAYADAKLRVGLAIGLDSIFKKEPTE